MASSGQHHTCICGISRRLTTSALALAIVLALTFAAPQSAQAQTFNVIHNFTGGGDGANPYAGVTMDRAENLYGTTSAGGVAGYGEVFKLKRSGSNWVLSPLYSFTGGNDGAEPRARVIFGPDGTLYGTTTTGGRGDCYGGLGCGTVFRVRPQAHACAASSCPWTETVLFPFTGGTDGAVPWLGDLMFDQAGNIYGTTLVGGQGFESCPQGCGIVYKLTPSHGNWTHSVVYSFTGGTDGGQPMAGVVFDRSGNLYGTATLGGDPVCGQPYGCGTVYQLTPSGSGWTENTLYGFEHGTGTDGDFPAAGLIFDTSGNLYGATITGGIYGGGTVFQLAPSGGNWIYTVLHSFLGGGGPCCSLTMDTAGNLYGTTAASGAYVAGSVFKLTPSGDGWNYTTLHDFTGGSDGGFPQGSVAFDANGNLYGTTVNGGTHGLGVVFEITQPF